MPHSGLVVLGHHRIQVGIAVLPKGIKGASRDVAAEVPDCPPNVDQSIRREGHDFFDGPVKPLPIKLITVARNELAHFQLKRFGAYRLHNLNGSGGGRVPILQVGDSAVFPSTSETKRAGGAMQDDVGHLVPHAEDGSDRFARSAVDSSTGEAVAPRIFWIGNALSFGQKNVVGGR